jgi:hypothetical protein
VRRKFDATFGDYQDEKEESFIFCGRWQHIQGNEEEQLLQLDLLFGIMPRQQYINKN